MDTLKKTFNRFEIPVALFVFALIIFGVICSYVNNAWFENVYAFEDGFIEWLTVVALLITSCIAFSYLFKLASKRSWLFFIVVLVICVFCFFCAGEEISWGQRIFNIKSSEYFLKNNSQKEITIHNLVINNQKLNKIIFSQFLIAAAAVYLIILPLLYNKNQSILKFIDWAGVPVAKLYQVICCIGIFILTPLTASIKGSELLEFGSCFMFMLIVSFPQNTYVFRK